MFKLWGTADCANWTCFFEPLSLCDYPDTLAEDWYIRPGENATKPHDFQWWSYGARGLKVIPYDERGAGLFRWAARVYEFLLRPNEDLRKYIDNVSHSLREPAIGMHVRRGDACPEGEGNADTRHTLKGRICQPLQKYMAHARRLRDKYQIKRLFLATDSPQIIERVSHEYTHEFDIVVQQNAIRREQSAYLNDLLKEHKLPMYAQEARSLAVDLLMLSKCSAFVGTFTSNVDRIAYALMANRHDKLPPYISLDSHWCMAPLRLGEYGSPYGAFYC